MTSLMNSSAVGRFLLSLPLILPLISRGAEIGARGADGKGLEKADRSPTPVIAPASTEAEIRIKQFRVPLGFKVELFAAEPMLANPVSFCIDEKNRFYVAETHRYRTSVLDIRNYMFMLEDDLASRTVEDRAAMSRRYFGERAKDLEVETEVIRFIEDRSGSGKADYSTVFADGFSTILDGIGSGVIARKGKVWFTNIPELWMLDGPDSNGKSTKRESLSHGYGVHFSLTGHDMHGLTFGPDGKLYFSFGDRAANVKTKEGKTLYFPDEGGVFRCNPDGTDMEMFASGLRNPQELAFDDYGNLFTGDNDSDLGDHERWVYVVEGGDSGWRIGYQNNPMGNAGPWNFEKLWVPYFDGQAAYIVPPVANILDGPSGLTYNPGVGFPAKYDKHFFLCFFKGSSGRSAIQAYTTKPKGAGFELTDAGPFVDKCLSTDVDFGYDGAMYFTDWNEGWEKSRKGRLYKVYDPITITDPLVAQVRKTFAEGFDQRTLPELAKLLEHKDRRMRQEAQFALAEKGTASIKTLEGIAAGNANQIARIHGIWGLGQIGRKQPAALTSLTALLSDADAEIRAQAAKVLGEAREAKAYGKLIELLKDRNLRVRFFAAQGLAKFGKPDAVAPTIAMLRENADKDLFLRHAGIMVLAKCADKSSLVSAGKDASYSVRIATVIAMRRQQLPEVSQFLSDKDPRIVVEAARAISDVPIAAAYPQLAALAHEPARLNVKYDYQGDSVAAFGMKIAPLAEPLTLRVVNAGFRSGTTDGASGLAQLAADPSVFERGRTEALFALATWAQPAQRDRLVGIYRPLPARDPKPAADALRPVVGSILKQAPEAVQIAAAQAAEKLMIKEAGPVLFELVSEQKSSSKARVEALKALAGLKDARVADAIKLAQADTDEGLRKEGNRLAAQSTTGDATVQITAILAKGSLSEKQSAITSLGTVAGASADKLLAQQLDALIAGTLPKELALEIVEAAATRPSPEVKARLEKYQSTKPPADKIAPYREALYGGNAAEGKKIFFEKVEASCLRCHKIGDEGGEAGPNLTGVASRKPREYFLESIVDPNAQIAAGFESVIVELKNGTSYAGILKSETDQELAINSPEDGLIKIKKENIKSRQKGLSGMLEGLKDVLTRRELRDLVEYLASLK